MALIYPADLTDKELAGGFSSELGTLGFLKDNLNNDFSVFHSVHWTRAYQKYTVFGEIDFVVVHKSGKVIFIEQKNGPLNEGGEGLVKDYGDNKKSVSRQIERSVNQVKSKYQYQNGKSQPLKIDYLLFCPDYRVRQVNAAGIDANRIVDASKDQQLAEIIQNIVEGEDAVDSYTHKRIIGFFSQSYALEADLHTRKDKLNERFVLLSEGIVKTISNLEINPFKLRVLGTAGCGKSLLAKHFYDEALAKNQRVLLLCYNRPLADYLREKLDDGGNVSTWFGFCDNYLQKQGAPLDFSQMASDTTFWDSAVEQLFDMHVAAEDKYDLLIVDEGQDFEESWWLVIQEQFLKEDSRVLWLEDPMQDVRNNQWAPKNFPVTYHAKHNFRSPYHIAKYIQETLPFEFDIANGLQGLGVQEFNCNNEEAVIQCVSDAVKSALRNGFESADIVILTAKSLRNSALSHTSKLDKYDLCKFKGNYDNAGKQQYTEGELLFETIGRFKGRQSPVVILLDLESKNDEIVDEQLKLAFVGMTRATVKLTVIKSVLA